MRAHACASVRMRAWRQVAELKQLLKVKGLDTGGKKARAQPPKKTGSKNMTMPTATSSVRDFNTYVTTRALAVCSERMSNPTAEEKALASWADSGYSMQVIGDAGVEIVRSLMPVLSQMAASKVSDVRTAFSTAGKDGVASSSDLKTACA